MAGEIGMEHGSTTLPPMLLRGMARHCRSQVTALLHHAYDSDVKGACAAIYGGFRRRCCPDSRPARPPSPTSATPIARSSPTTPPPPPAEPFCSPLTLSTAAPRPPP